MNIQEIVNIIEQTAPARFAASWDKSGMQVASEDADIGHLAVMLDPSPQNIAKAVDCGAQFALSHHPLALQPELPGKINDYYRALKLLITNNICLYSAHTSLDANPLGPAKWLAESLNLQDCVTLDACGTEQNQPFGFGFVGNLPQAESFPVFGKKLLALLGLDSLRICGPKPEIVARVAYCPGSGGSMVELAQSSGADVYITGDIRFHTALESKICILDPGHFILEEIMMQAFAKTLAAKLPALKITYIKGKDPLGMIIF